MALKLSSDPTVKVQARRASPTRNWTAPEPEPTRSWSAVLESTPTPARAAISHGERGCSTARANDLRDWRLFWCLDEPSADTASASTSRVVTGRSCSAGGIGVSAGGAGGGAGGGGVGTGAAAAKRGCAAGCATGVQARTSLRTGPPAAYSARGTVSAAARTEERAEEAEKADWPLRGTGVEVGRAL